MNTTATHARAFAVVTGAAATYTATDGHTEAVRPTADEDIRQTVILRAQLEARRTGTPVELLTSGDRGQYRLLIDADGTYGVADRIATTTAVVDRPTQIFHGEGVRERAPQSGAISAPNAPAAEPGTRPHFLEPAASLTPRPGGWRGMLARFGVTIPPSAVERGRAEQSAIASRHWAGCRTIAVANGKGGVGKTMTTAMLAAVYARHGGGNVLAWDNNDTRGTLGWRTDSGLYETTIRDLLPAAHDLLSPQAGLSDVTRFVHHQGSDRYDVLRSNPELLATDQRIATAEFDLLMQVAARYYRLVIFDSGNDESAERWLRMVDSSYQLVIPTIATPESAESASLLLDALRRRDDRSAILADNAVVVVTQSEPTAGTAARRIADGFRGHVRAVQQIPYDPALKSGPLRYDALHRHTQDAWLAAAAATAGIL